jgi:uncharacterized protein (TIGR02302 family)
MSDLNIKIALQRASLFWEDLWQALQQPLMVLGVAIILLASDSLSSVPKYMELAVLGVLALAFLYSLNDIVKLKSPQRLPALRRMERASNIDHRAVSSHDDELVLENQSAETTSLWEEHQRRKLTNLSSVKISPPTSAWRLFDPTALRVPVALGAVAALLLGSGDLISNTQNAFNLSGPVIASPLTIDAWLRPPAYTGKPPVLLTSAAMQDKLKAGTAIEIPENSTLTLRVQGAQKPRLAFFAEGDLKTELNNIIARSSTNETGFTSDVKLERPVTVKLIDGASELASWPITVIPDAPPMVKIAGEPKTEKLGALNIGWETSDDYGVKTVTAEISLADEQENGVGFENNGVFLFDAPVFKIALRHPTAKTEAGNTTQDLASHPWAGLFVEIALTATDGAGHSTTTAPKRFKMPQREFSKPLAAAIIEQRKSLILNPDAAPDVATMLDAMLAYPYSIRDQSKLVLNLAYTKSSLANAGDTDEVGAAITDLWPLAVAIEDGELADVRAELKSLKQQLEQALRDGASQDKIAELTEKMRRAMDKLLDQMRKESEKLKAEGSDKNKKSGREISKQELQKMLDDIKKLSESGSKESAEQLLSELDKLLQNLQPGQGEQADQNGDPALQRQMDALSDMMHKQQELMDQTQRMPQDGGDQGLGDKQGGLSEQLDRMNKDMDGDAQGHLGDASKNMKGAAGKLRDGSKEDALQQQGQAMRDMQEGAKKLGKKLAEARKGQQGRDGEAGNNTDDPLGRPRATHNSDNGPDKNLIPSELAQRRAREILEQLRNRSNDQNLGETEKDYIERLLKGQY